MVERTLTLDAVFGSLSDPIRRDIVQRVSNSALSVSTIARNYEVSFAGVAKHLNVLERAGLIRKTRRGREQIITLNPEALALADGYLERYRELWEARLDALGAFVQTEQQAKE